MIQKVFIAGAVLFVLILGFWIQDLRTQNDHLKTKFLKLEAQYTQLDKNYRELYDHYQAEVGEPSPPPDPGPSTQSQLTAARADLEGLRKQLADLQKAGPMNSEDPAPHLARDRKQIENLQAQLTGLSEESLAVDHKSKQYLDSQTYDRDQRKLNLQTQIQQLNDSIDQVKIQIAGLQRRENPNYQSDLGQLNSQILSLRQQRDGLQNQRTALDLQGKTTHAQVEGEVQKEKDEMAGERKRARASLKRVTADLERWKKIEAAQGSAKARQEQVEGLKKEIAVQTEKVKSLENTAKSADK